MLNKIHMPFPFTFGVLQSSIEKLNFNIQSPEDEEFRIPLAQKEYSFLDYYICSKRYYSINIRMLSLLTMSMCISGIQHP